MPNTLYPLRSETAPPTVSASWTVGRVCLFLAAALAIVRAAIHVRANWISDAGIDHTAGVIIAMSADLTHGVFYRPLFGPQGYGGTRYFPLYFVLHAALLKLHVPVLLGAYLVSLIAVLFLMVGVFYLLVRLGAERWLAAACVGTLLASASAQCAVLIPHSDGLASAFIIWGLVMIVGPKCSWREVVLAAIFLTLAFSAKPTACFGLAVATFWLASVGLRRRALQLAGVTTLGYLLVAGGMVVFSHERVVGIFKACALGGTNWKRFLDGPLFMEWNAFHSDLNVFLLLLFALTAAMVELLESPTKCLKQLPVVMFIAALLTTIGIYGSPGTNVNHLLDVQVAAVVFLGWLAARPSQVQRQVGTYALALAILVPAGIGAATLLHKQPAGPALASDGNRLNRVVAFARKSDKPVLAENPIIPVLTGHSPYVLDPWMLSLLRKRIPGFGEPLLQQLRNRAFGVVVLFEDPESDYGRDWYDTQHFGPGFTAALRGNYRLLSATDGQFVYVPID